MTDIIVLSLASLVASALTLFSGFGLGTLLMPVFALFFPLPLAIGMTAVVHLANNLFKLAVFGRRADRKVALTFGFPALIAAVAGAGLLVKLGSPTVLFEWELFGRAAQGTSLKLLMGLLIVFFALMDMVPRLAEKQFDPKWLGLGGAVSGFLGGLSGHQGALRSAFLIRLGLSKEAFIGTGVVLACLVDLARLSVYGFRGVGAELFARPAPVIAATAAAFVGVFVGARLVKKVTILTVQRVVGAGLLLIGTAMSAGLI